MTHNIRQWIKTGEPWIWLNAGAVTVSVLMVIGLTLLIAVRGMEHFWPAPVEAFRYSVPGEKPVLFMGQRVDEEQVTAFRAGLAKRVDPNQLVSRHLYKTGNRDFLGIDFRWVNALDMENLEYPDEAMVVERREWGDFIGVLKAVKRGDTVIESGTNVWPLFQRVIDESTAIFDEIRHIEKDRIGGINYRIERLRLQERSLELDGVTGGPEFDALEAERQSLQREYDSYTRRLGELYEDLNTYSFVATLADGKEAEIPLSKVVRAYRPNAMSLVGKVQFYLAKIWEFVSEDPREANTEGGIFPAIFGTVLMVIIMSIIVTPFGVVAAVYLREYASQGPLTRLIRISVNNLAGVPSIVYGVFGLGFFVYFLGGSIDKLFFPESLPAPTFGTPGLMWASLTLAILTVPVVIVATEEGLSRVPRSIREGSLALGATKAETLWRTVLPMTSSAMITGLILAVARAAGEVAPLMLVGVVKLAPSLPLDGNFPFLHLERKFMHLGFHIYDVGFQSPNVEAARPLVYATSFLLVVIIITLNLTAIRIRNTLREKYRAAEQS
jgi:phosphate transport system permease protein